MSWMKAIADQVLGNPKLKLVIAQKAKKLMEVRHLSEQDVTDVFYHGEAVDEHMMVRQYNGYTVGLWHFRDSKTGNAVVTSVWKR